MRCFNNCALLQACLALAPVLGVAAPVESIPGPDRRIEVAFYLTERGEPRYSVRLEGEVVLRESGLRLVRDDADFTRGLKLASVSNIATVTDQYELATSKRRLNSYTANDGVGFRYVFPQEDSSVKRISAEASTFNFPEGTRAWLQPIARTKTGWSSTNPSYEELYERDIPVGTPSPTGAGWVYPALFRAGERWMLISESGLTRHYCGSRLQSQWRSTEYSIAFPDALEHFQGGPVSPQSTLPWITPWRLIVIGDLKTIVESSLGTDLAAKPVVAPRTSRPDKASWSWPLLGDSETV